MSVDRIDEWLSGNVAVPVAPGVVRILLEEVKSLRAKVAELEADLENMGYEMKERDW